MSEYVLPMNQFVVARSRFAENGSSERETETAPQTREFRSGNLARKTPGGHRRWRRRWLDTSVRFEYLHTAVVTPAALMREEKISQHGSTGHRNGCR
jgi:hypothetical protein